MLWLFTAAGAEALLRRHGFVDVKVRKVAKRVGAGSVMNLLAEKAPFGGRPISRLATSPAVRRLTIPYALGDLIVVTGTRSVD